MYPKPRSGQQNYLPGCGFVLLLLLIGLAGLVALSLRREHQAVRYPGATLVSGHGHYQGLPRHLLWIKKYQTPDPLWAIYNWYTEEHDLTPLSMLSDGCFYLQGYRRWSYVTRSTSVTLCETAQGQTITVTWLTSVW